MTKAITLVLISITMPLILFSQSVIHLKASDTVISAEKVYYSSGVLLYKDSIEQRNYKELNFQEVDYIKIRDRYYGLSPKRKVLINTVLAYNDTVFKGAVDACRFYDTKGAQTATFISTFGVGAILGLVPAISISSTNPKDKNLKMPENALKNDVLYNNGYKKQAKKIKQRNTWNGYGGGIAALIVLFYFVQYSGLIHYNN